MKDNFKTKHFYMKSENSTIDLPYGGTWDVYRKENDTCVGSLELGKLDAYQCVDYTVNIEGITFNEYTELFDSLENLMSACIFFRSKCVEDETIQTAFKFLHYEFDELDKRYLIHERPVMNFTAVYMGCGIAIGLSLYKTIGMSLGLAFGYAIGQSIDKKSEKERELLRNSRLQKN